MRKDFTIKREYFYIAYAIVVILTAIVGLRFVTLYFGENSNIVKHDTYEKYYAIIADDSSSTFWESVYEGAHEYGLDKGVYVENFASSFSEKLSKEQLMRIAIASNVDGIMINADESEAMNSLIDEAVSKNIPVVTLYNDASSSRRISYVGVGNYNIGQEYGKQALGICKSLSWERTGGIDIVVLVSSVPTSSQMLVYSGIQETLETDILSSRITLNTVKIDDSNTFTIEETIRDIFMNEDVPDMIVCLSELDTTCVYQAVIDYNKVGQVNILGFYDSAPILNAIDRNIINSTIALDTRQMGEYCVDALLEYDRVGFTSQYFAVDIEVINSDNVKLHMEETAYEN